MASFKNFSLQKKNYSLIKYLAGFFLLSMFILALNFFSAPVRNVFYAVSSPLQKGAWTAGESSSGFFASLINAGGLSSENDSLRQENQKLVSEVISLQSINTSNQAQTNMSLNAQNNGFNLLLAGVTGLDKDVLSINKGTDNGIKEGMPVVDQQNVLLGKVYKVYKNFSQIMLISNPQSVVNIKVEQTNPDQTINEINGALKGSGNGNMYIDLIPIDANLTTNDTIITSSLDTVFPKELLIGQVGQITKNDQKPFQQAIIRPFSTITTTDNVFVITNYKQAN